MGDRLAQVISEAEVEAVVGDVSVLEDAEAMIEADVGRFWRLDNSSPKREQSSWIP